MYKAQSIPPVIRRTSFNLATDHVVGISHRCCLPSSPLEIEARATRYNSRYDPDKRRKEWEDLITDE